MKKMAPAVFLFVLITLWTACGREEQRKTERGPHLVSDTIVVQQGEKDGKPETIPRAAPDGGSSPSGATGGDKIRSEKENGSSGKGLESLNSGKDSDSGEEESMYCIQIEVNGEIFSMLMYENEASAALLEKLPMRIRMNDLNKNEKYYSFSESLPTDPIEPEKINKGDLMLYGSDCLVLFYQDFITSYSYTPLGSVEEPARLAQVLGEGEAEIFFYIK